MKKLLAATLFAAGLATAATPAKSYVSLFIFACEARAYSETAHMSPLVRVEAWYGTFWSCVSGM